jgi:hypothetical protein
MQLWRAEYSLPGGWIRIDSRLTIVPFKTLTNPIWQMLAWFDVAVSMSMAVKAEGVLLVVIINERIIIQNNS